MSFDFGHSSDEEDVKDWTHGNSFCSLNSDVKEACRSDEIDGSVRVSDETDINDDWNDTTFASKKGDDDSQSDCSDRTGAVDWDFLKKEDVDDSDSGVDWEDADNDDAKKIEAETCNKIKSNLIPVTVDFTNSAEGSSMKLSNGEVKVSKKSRKSRQTLRLKFLPPKIQSLIQNLHRCHVLSLTAHTMYISNLCYQNPELLFISHSMLPVRWISKQQYSQIAYPSLTDIKALFTWYINLVHGADRRLQIIRRRNRSAGAPITTTRRPQSNRASRKRKSAGFIRQEEDSEGTLIPTDQGQVVHETVATRLIEFAQYLCLSQLEDPQLATITNKKWTHSDICVLFLSMIRSMGWRCRYVQAMNPMKLDLDASHPVLNSTFDVFRLANAKILKGKSGKTLPDAVFSAKTDNDVNSGTSTSFESVVYGWIEVFCSIPSRGATKHRWIHLDPVQNIIDQPAEIETALSRTWIENCKPSNKTTVNSTQRIQLAYVIGVEHCVGSDDTMKVKLTDVTPRYAQSWISALRLRGVIHSKKCNVEEQYNNSWWVKSLNSMNVDLNAPNNINDLISVCRGTDINLKGENLFDHLEEQQESAELKSSASIEVIPKSKAAFQTHPVYVIPSVLGTTEVLAPDASKRVCGMFKGEFVYRRSDVSNILPAKKWLYQGRQVLSHELKNPIKTVAPRKKVVTKKFQALKSYTVGTGNDGSLQQRRVEVAKSMEDLDDGKNPLYAIWQTELWSPRHVGPDDPIPMNEYKNVEFALINPGLVHIDVKGLSRVAYRLGIPYAPCLLGFEGHGSNRTPTISGIVVHIHNEQLLREAGAEFTSHEMEEEQQLMRQKILQRWKKLMLGILTKERVEREYG